MRDQQRIRSSTISSYGFQIHNAIIVIFTRSNVHKIGLHLDLYIPFIYRKMNKTTHSRNPSPSFQSKKKKKAPKKQKRKSKEKFCSIRPHAPPSISVNENVWPHYRYDYSTTLCNYARIITVDPTPTSIKNFASPWITNPCSPPGRQTLALSIIN